MQRIPLRRDAPSFGLQIPAPDASLRRRLRLPVRPAGRRHADRQRGSGPMAAAPPEQGLVRRAEFRVETAHLCRRVDIHDGRQPAHRLPAGTGADHAAALPNPRRIRDDRRSRAVRLQRHAFARGTRSQPAGRLHRTGGIRAVRRHRHPVARHDHRPRPRRTGKYRHHHQSQPGLPTRNCSPTRRGSSPDARCGAGGAASTAAS